MNTHIKVYLSVSNDERADALIFYQVYRQIFLVLAIIALYTTINITQITKAL